MLGGIAGSCCSSRDELEDEREELKNRLAHMDGRGGEASRSRLLARSNPQMDDEDSSSAGNDAIALACLSEAPQNQPGGGPITEFVPGETCIW
jgi:hypothetical protein